MREINPFTGRVVSAWTQFILDLGEYILAPVIWIVKKMRRDQ